MLVLHETCYVPMQKVSLEVPLKLDGGRGLHSFPLQLNLSSSIHRITQINS